MDKTGQLMDIHRKELGSEIAAIAIAPVPEGRQRALFMVCNWLFAFVISYFFADF
jgi:hypothetical protein